MYWEHNRDIKNKYLRDLTTLYLLSHWVQSKFCPNFVSCGQSYTYTIDDHNLRLQSSNA